MARGRAWPDTRAIAGESGRLVGWPGEQGQRRGLQPLAGRQVRQDLAPVDSRVGLAPDVCRRFTEEPLVVLQGALVDGCELLLIFVAAVARVVVHGLLEDPHA